MREQAFDASLHDLRDSWRGIGFILLAGVFAVASGAMVKLLTPALPSLQIAFVRALVTSAILFPFILKSGVFILASQRPRLMTLRSLNAALIIVLNVYAVGHMPLVDFTAIGFATPILVIPLSALFLGEKMRLRRSVATLFGFLGVLLIVRPTGEIASGTLAALLATVLLAIGVMFVRLLSKTEPTIRLMAWSAAIVVIGLAYPALAAWQTPTLLEWMLLILGGVAGSGTQFFIICAYERGNPTLVAPFDYGRILVATFAGILVFMETPDAWTIGGTLLVIASGLYIALRDARMGRRNTTDTLPR